jgi:hypothetical protein
MRPRKSTLNKKLEDDAKLLRAWRAWHREELEEALAGPYRGTSNDSLSYLRA